MNIKNKSHAVTADIVVPEGGGSGALIAQGGQYGGWVTVELVGPWKGEPGTESW